jgi:hypothetical protein
VGNNNNSRRLTNWIFFYSRSVRKEFVFENHFLNATALRSATAESNPIGWY